MMKKRYHVPLVREVSVDEYGAIICGSIGDLEGSTTNGQGVEIVDDIDQGDGAWD